MTKHHPKNERIKRAYFLYLEEAQRMEPKSVDQVAAALAQFEASTGHRDFAAFHIEQARRFKRLLAERTDTKTRRPLAKATITARLKALRRFFHWLAGQPGYRSRIAYADADYFNPSANDGRIAGARRERPVPSIEQVRHVLAHMPTGTAIERRDQALIAFDPAPARWTLMQGRETLEEREMGEGRRRREFPEACTARGGGSGAHQRDDDHRGGG